MDWTCGLNWGHKTYKTFKGKPVAKPPLGRPMKRRRNQSGILQQLFIDFKKASNTVVRKMLHSTLTKFSIPIKPVWLITICLTETYKKSIKANICPINFLFTVVCSKILISTDFNFALKYAIMKIQKTRRDLTWMAHINFWSMLITI
jgi:hypothetical protein